MTRSTDSFEDKNRTAVLPSPETLIEQYAALVWKTISDYLDDPAKGSYASFLVAIARNSRSAAT